MDRDEEWLLKEKWGGQMSPGFLADRARLQAGEPLAYLIGHVPFLNTTIHLDSHPLIPRTETEYWVERILSEFRRGPASEKEEVRVLDLCAGSGCIGVAVLKALPHSRVDFAEIDAGHHPTILKNIHANDIDVSRTRIFGGDLFEYVSDTYDLILSNPPYIDASLGRTENSVLAHEPHGALFAADAGFELIARMIHEAPKFLTSTGILVIEHEPEHTLRIVKTAQQNDFLTDTEKDQYGLERYTVFTRKKEKNV